MSDLVYLQSASDLGSTLKTRRTSRAIKQEQLASVVNISRYTLVDLESGKSDPRLSTIIKLADALGFKLALVPRDIEIQTQTAESQGIGLGEEIDLDSIEDIETAWKGE
ncbi:helix-turn-helix domain-containing protein [Rhizobium sp. MHM7A]|nr:helix-turn-helix domain-containing protein [Rhizobium sp. MHM7A]